MKSHPIIFSAVAAIVLSSCAGSGSNPGNQSRAKFLDQVWVAPALRGKAVSDTYRKVYFAPVKVDHLKQQDWWSSQNARTKEHLAADAKGLARYADNALRKAANNYPAKRLQVVSGPGPGTLVVESSIVELVPAKAFWNSTASAAGFVIPGAGLLGTFGKGAITFEGRLRDGGTGTTLATFRDRNTDKMAIVNVDSYTWYHGSEANIDDLAAKTAEVLNTPKSNVVKSSDPIKLIAY